MTNYRAKAPLRLGLAGGGTDLGAYAKRYGGAVLNATVNLYVYASIHPREDRHIELVSTDYGETILLPAARELPIDGKLDLLKGVYNRIVREYVDEPLSFTLITDANVPIGSGLGTSSAITVAVIGAFMEWLKLPLGEYEVAQFAYAVERKDLALAGGKQDQYAASFGGFNFIEFDNGDVIVNPLRVKRETILELENNMVAYFTGQSRVSAEIILSKEAAVTDSPASLELMHRMKALAFEMKRLLLKGKTDEIGALLDTMWRLKRRTAPHISNPAINEVYEAARKAGALGGKVSGAGGGGFMYFYCPDDTKYKVMRALSRFPGEIRRFQFAAGGLETWEK